jgi:hypothetical protein
VSTLGYDVLVCAEGDQLERIIGAAVFLPLSIKAASF